MKDFFKQNIDHLRISRENSTIWSEKIELELRKKGSKTESQNVTEFLSYIR